MALAVSRYDIASVIDRPDYERYSGINISPGANSAVLSDTASKNYSILSILLSGDGDGEFTIFLNSVEFFRMRNSWSEKGQGFAFDGKRINSGDVITIYCKNTSPNSSYYTARINGKER